MTREEAIRLIGWLKCTTNREDDLEAIDMAIEALSLAELKPNFESANTVSRFHHDMEVKELKRQIKDQAEMVAVVRCKDCRYQIKEKGIMWCSHEDGVCGDAPDNFYCAYGEKEDE